MWKRYWTGTTWIFILNRYGLLLLAAVNCVQSLLSQPQVCLLFYFKHLSSQLTQYDLEVCQLKYKQRSHSYGLGHTTAVSQLAFYTQLILSSSSPYLHVSYAFTTNLPSADHTVVFSTLRLYAISDCNILLSWTALVIGLTPVATNIVRLAHCVSSDSLTLLHEGIFLFVHLGAGI